MKQKILVILLILVFAVSSCKVQQQQFGNYENQQGKSVVHDKGKEIYLFWDQVQLQNVEDDLNIQDYEKIKRKKFFDYVVTYGTMGIFSYYSVTIKTKEAQDNNR